MAPAATEFFISPYMLDVERDAASVCWRTSLPIASRFTWTASDGRQGTIVTPRAERHTVRLTGLPSSTVFECAVDGQRAVSFRTLSADDEAMFAVIGHTHGTEQFDHYPDTLLADAVRRQAPDFVLHAGDATWSATVADYRSSLFLPFGRLLAQTPIHLAPGNHDSGWPFHDGLSLGAVRELFPRSWPAVHDSNRSAYYSFTRAGIRFCMLCYTVDLQPGSEQLRWLASELAEPATLHVVVFGGAQQYYNEPALLDFLVDNGCDLVFRGDGLQPAQCRRDHRGMPMYFVGTGSEQPHAFLRCDWRRPLLRIERHLPTGTEVLLDEFRVADGELKPGAATPRLTRGPLVVPTPPRISVGETTIALVPAAKDREFDAAMESIVAALDPDLVVRAAAEPAPEAPAKAAAEGVEPVPAFSVSQVGSALVTVIPAAGLAAFAQGVPATLAKQLAAHRGLRLAVVAGQPSRLAPEHPLLPWLGSGIFDAVLLPDVPPRERTRRRLGGTTAFDLGSKTPGVVAIELHDTHLTVKRIVGDRSARCLGWAYPLERGEQRRPLSGDVTWKTGQATIVATVPRDGMPATGIGLRLIRAATQKPASLYLLVFPRGLPPASDRGPSFSGFRSSHFRIDHIDGLVRMPLPLDDQGRVPPADATVLVVVPDAKIEDAPRIAEAFWYN